MEKQLENQEKMADINYDVFTKLPQDIIFLLLMKLPPKTLLQLRCVSRFFNFLISHPHFLNLHIAAAPAAPHGHHLVYYESTDYTKSYFSFHAEQTFSLCKIFDTPFKSVNGYIRLVGSYRGILCLFDTSYFTFVGTVILWNPFIRKFKIVPNLQELSCVGTHFSHMAVGFGFDQRIDDFRVVKILYDCHNEPDFLPKAFVYDLKIGSWRMIKGQVVPCFLPKNWSSSVFVNEAVHWLAYKRPKFSGQPNCIMGFDLIEEFFKSIELPKNLGLDGKELRLSPSVDEKSVALFVSAREHVSEVWDLWFMSDYGNIESWKRVFTIVLDHEFFPLKIVNGGEILAATKDKRLVLIDVEKDEFKDLEICGLPSSFYVDGYFPSLALLDNGERFIE